MDWWLCHCKPSHQASRFPSELCRDKANKAAMMIQLAFDLSSETSRNRNGGSGDSPVNASNGRIYLERQKVVRANVESLISFDESTQLMTMRCFDPSLIQCCLYRLIDLMKASRQFRSSFVGVFIKRQRQSSSSASHSDGNQIWPSAGNVFPRFSPSAQERSW